MPFAPCTSAIQTSELTCAGVGLPADEAVILVVSIHAHIGLPDPRDHEWGLFEDRIYTYLTLESAINLIITALIVLFTG